MEKQKYMEKQRFYYDKNFLGSKSGRPIRILSEYLFPLESFQKHKVDSTVVFFGSARIENKNDTPINKYYKKARDLAYVITKWNMEKYDGKKFVVTSGAGPGIMEAANRGAFDVGCKSIGLNIKLPAEQQPNPFITPELCFQFKYFALRKFHFILRLHHLILTPKFLCLILRFLNRFRLAFSFLPLQLLSL